VHIRQHKVFMFLLFQDSPYTALRTHEPSGAAVSAYIQYTGAHAVAKVSAAIIPSIVDVLYVTGSSNVLADVVDPTVVVFPCVLPAAVGLPSC
jgi:hypothetical protein